LRLKSSFYCYLFILCCVELVHDLHNCSFVSYPM
jgi:hypothetical protein